MLVWQPRRGNPARGLAEGLIAGLAASWVMNRFQDGVAKLSANAGKATEGTQQGAAAYVFTGSAPSDREESSEPSTRVVATAVAEKVFHHKLRPAERPAAETAVHYGFGTLVGGLYGIAAERWRAARAGNGSLFGAGVWLVSDEMALPALGIAKPVFAYPAKVHASALAAHVVYGVSLELLRRGLRKIG